MQIRLSPETRESISVAELAKHIFNVIKKAKGDSHWYRNYPTIIQNLLNDLCRTSDGNLHIDDNFAGKFDEAIALLKKQNLLVDTIGSAPTVRLTSLGESHDLMISYGNVGVVKETIHSESLKRYLEKIKEVSSNNYASFPHWTNSLFEYMKDNMSYNTVFNKYEENSKKWSGWLKNPKDIDLYDRENAKQIAYTVYKEATIRGDKGTKGNDIYKFSGKDDPQANLRYFHERFFGYLKEAIEDIISGKSSDEESDIILDNIVDAQIDSQVSKPENRDEIMKNGIFIVHGHDSLAKLQLKSLLTDWKLNPIILHEQANQGRTIIEKFEDHADKVGCAIVLLTPDDEGRSITDDKGNSIPTEKRGKLELKARQNVILELGFFFAKLGRGKVICLYKGDVELPSDITGIAFIPFDNDLKKEVYSDLRRELVDMGFDVKG